MADASHELRTPLTAIRTNVEFLARVPGARTEDRVEALRDVLIELRRMESLVGDLLALARLEAAVATPARRTFRLDHMVADVHRDALRIAAPEVEVTLGPLPEVWVSGDRDDLRRAVWNLVDNALKYTRAGTIDLRLRAEDGMAELTVRDTGIGIAEGHLRPRVRPLLARPERPWHGRVGPRPGHHPLGRPGARGHHRRRVGRRPGHDLRAHPAGRPAPAQALPAPRGRAARCQPGDRFGTSFLRVS